MAYFLEFKLPKGEIVKKEVRDIFTFGNDPSNTFQVQDCGLASCHFTFRYVNNVLSITNHAQKNKAQIGTNILNYGKIYLLEAEDVIDIDDTIQITILSESQQELENSTKTLDLDQSQEELADPTKTSFLEKPQEELADPTKTSFLEKPQEELADPTKTSFLEKPQEELADSH